MRICPCCPNSIDTKIHFLLYCVQFNQLRKTHEKIDEKAIFQFGFTVMSKDVLYINIGQTFQTLGQNHTAKFWNRVSSFDVNWEKDENIF